MSEKKPIPYYRNTEDTLSTVGITKRQLNYWRSEGLFHPELNDGNRFTHDDTWQLHFLKSLIVELGLPIATVKRLMPEAAPGLPFRRFYNHTYIDVRKQQMITPDNARGDLLAQQMFDAKPETLLEWFKALAAELLKKYARASTPSVYATQKEELLDAVRKADLYFRIQQGEDGLVIWRPRPTDVEVSQEELEDLEFERTFTDLLRRLYELNREHPY